MEAGGTEVEVEGNEKWGNWDGWNWGGLKMGFGQLVGFWIIVWLNLILFMGWYLGGDKDLHSTILKMCLNKYHGYLIDFIA